MAVPPETVPVRCQRCGATFHTPKPSSARSVIPMWCPACGRLAAAPLGADAPSGRSAPLDDQWVAVASQIDQQLDELSVPAPLAASARSETPILGSRRTFRRVAADASSARSPGVLVALPPEPAFVPARELTPIMPAPPWQPGRQPTSPLTPVPAPEAAAPPVPTESAPPPEPAAAPAPPEISQGPVVAPAPAGPVPGSGRRTRALMLGAVLCMGALIATWRLWRPPAPSPVRPPAPAPAAAPAPPLPAAPAVAPPAAEARPTPAEEPEAPAPADESGPSWTPEEEEAALAQARRLACRSPRTLLPLFRRMAALKAGGPDAHVGLGACALRTERYLAATEHFERALKQRDRHPPALLGLAHAFRLRGEDARALELYRAYLETPRPEKARLARRHIQALEKRLPGD